METRRIRLLLVEDRASDAELIIHELRRAGFDPIWERVDDEAGFRSQLSPELDLILADFNLPQFDALRALAIVKASGLPIPFIIVSGSIGDTAAVESMRGGASDYIFKENLSRLAAAVKREVEAADQRRVSTRAREESAARLRAVIQSALDAVVSIDADGRVLAWNPQAESLFGWREHEAVGSLLAELIIPAQFRDPHREGLARFHRTGEARILNRRVEVTALNKQGREFPVELSIIAVTAEGARSFSAFIRDITDRKQAETSTAAHLAVSRALAEAGPMDHALPRVLEAVASSIGWNLGQMWLVDETGTRLTCAHQWCRAGTEPRAFMRASAAARLELGQGIVGTVATSLAPTWLEDVSTGADRVLVAAAAADGLRSAAFIPLLSNGQVSGVLEFFSHQRWKTDPSLLQLMSDLSHRLGEFISRARAEAALQHRVRHDALTELPNRLALSERLLDAIDGNPLPARRLALLVINLDHFKDVNDTFGHQAGDELLKQVGGRLLASIRRDDFVARLASDEFAAVLEGVDKDKAATAAGKISAAMVQPFIIMGQSLAVEASIGIAAFPEDGDTAEALMRRADIALHVAKQTPGTVAAYSAAFAEQGASHLRLMAELRSAIQEGGLMLYYQPLIDIKTGSVVRLEALLRWQHPRLGWVPPDQFIPFAERTGVIHPLTDWVLETVLAQLETWHRAGHQLNVAVNISVRNLADASFPERVAEMLAERRIGRIDGHAPLSLEVTEGVLMSKPEQAIERLGRLRQLGLRLSVDDFGTGYSSLAYLSRLPVSEMKIDKSFIIGIAEDPNKAAIVRAGLDLGRNLRLEVVAEGVEDQRTWDLLAALGCDTAQGYYISRPMPVNDVIAWLDARRGRSSGHPDQQAA